ncbi:3-hydroxyacyl-CoA dehydrogenase family protein [Acetobacterium bakii]|uniref:3-hydroxyacyl-CoA dehydrogenase family protein n=1 Tax=Acetobacterium bakii TaxID=52689 RepID=UPI000681B2A0|nr:3-hydroxyacyl-CoA dehydrogenase family protein [Acetobacterium bakii]
MKLDSIKNVAIIGTGMIGASLAVLFTGNGYKTTILAYNDEEIIACKERYSLCFNDLIEKELVTEKQYKACEKILNITTSYKDIADTDLIFECVVENLAVKHSVYQLIEENCLNFKAIASSTSAISVDDLAKGLKQKEKLVVAHPWNPPHLVPCVELVPGQWTDKGVIEVIYDFLESAGRKVVVMKKAAPGFIGNRLQHALYREAVHMVEQGIATPEDIDKTLKYSFIPRYTSIGIFEHFDYAGLDMIVSIDDYLFPDLSNADKTQDYIRSRFEKGDLGQKTGLGVYDWSKVDMEAFRMKAAKPYFEFFNWSLPEED